MTIYRNYYFILKIPIKCKLKLAKSIELLKCIKIKFYDSMFKKSKR